MKKLIQKLRSNFYNKMYRYHRKKFYKYLSKSIGSDRYMYSYCQADAKELEELKVAFNSGRTHASVDASSRYPSVMAYGAFSSRFPLVNQPGSK